MGGCEMTINVIADSLADATPLILRAMRDYQALMVQVFIEPEFQGYFARLKQCPLPVSEQSVAQIKRDLRMYKNPQAYDVKLVSWPAYMYRGLSDGRKSSAF